MAAATVISGYPIRESLGSLTLFIWKLTAADTNTLATGLGANIVGSPWATSEANETAGEEGVNISNSSGTLTLGLKTTGTVWVFVLARA